VVAWAARPHGGITSSMLSVMAMTIVARVAAKKGAEAKIVN
jgi:hypothetical protein